MTAYRSRFIPQPRMELLFHSILLLVVLLATVAGYNSPLPLVIGAGDDLQQSFHGLYQVERDGQSAFRWTNGHSSICMHHYGYTLRSAVHITLMGQYAVPLGIDAVTLLVNEQQPVVAPLPPTTRHYHLLVDGRQQPGADLCVSLASTTHLSPNDPRYLGVQFQALEVRRLVQAGTSLPAPFHIGLNITFALLCFWLLRTLGIPTWLAALLLIGGATLLGIGIAAGFIETGIEVSRSLLLVCAATGMLLATSLGLRFVRPWEAPGTTPYSSFIILKHDLLAMGLWSLVLCLSVYTLQQAHGAHGVWPLKAGVWPGFTPVALIAGAAFAVWLALVLRHLSTPTSTSNTLLANAPWRYPLFFLLLFVLLAGAWTLPMLLRASVRGWSSLFLTFQPDPSDYIADVPRVGNPITFLSQYTTLSPTLAWHNSNHPPGSVLLLWLVEQVMGAGPVPATWVTILLSGLLPLAAFWLGWRIGGATLALLAGALVVTMPGHQIYSVTSMDGVFNAINALAAVACFLSLQPGARPQQAVLAGVLLALGLFFTYATTQLFFFGVAVGLLRLTSLHQSTIALPHDRSRTAQFRSWLRENALLSSQAGGFVVRQTLLTLGILAGIYLVLYLTTGFNIIEGSIQAKANNARLLAADPAAARPELLGIPSVAHYLYYLPVNLLPFLWYLAPWGLAALTSIIITRVRHCRQPDNLTILAVGTLTLVLGMLFSGLFVREVERIWGFVYPLTAVLMAVHIWQGTTQQERLWRAGLFLSLFFAQSAIMRMLLNTYW